jgi:photosystem II stability/assembly factor-like uncharacterized protein
LTLPVRIHNPTLSTLLFDPDHQAVLAMGSEGTVLRSVDDGKSWSNVATATREHLADAAVHAASKSILVVGSRGTLLRGDNAGARFSRVPVATQLSFRAVASTDVDGHIVTVGDDGMAYASTDGGNSFVAESTGTTNYLSKIVAVAGKARFIIGGDLGVLLVRDGKGRWRPIATPAKMLITALAVAADGSVVAGTQDGFILHSADSGETWTAAYKMREDMFVIGFDSNPTGSALIGRVRTRELLLSVDQGRSFQQLPFDPKQGLSRMAWVDGRGFVGLGLLGAVVTSDPTGQRWSLQTAPALASPSSVAIHPMTKTILAVGASGLIARSTDQGRHFEVVRPGLGGILRSMVWNPTKGCLVAAGLDATLLRADDPGTEWTRIPLSIDPRTELTQVVFEPKSEALVASGSNGTLLRSTDCGASWTQIRATTANVAGLSVQREGTLLALVTGGPMLRSTDGGRSYEPSKMDSDASLRRAISAGDGQGIVAVGNDGRIYRSVDDGRSWQRVTSGTTAHLRALELDATTRTLWTAGDAGVVLKSTDGGQSFTQIPTPTSENLFVIGLNPAAGRVLFGGNRGTVLLSEDQGKSFTELDSGSTQTIRVAMLDPVSQEFIVAGSGGTLLRTVGGKRLAKIAGNYEGRMDAALFHPPSGTIFIGGDRLLSLGGK